jgi:hypothetical protein
MSSLISLFAFLTPLLEHSLTVPEVGEHSLRVLTPRLLEMHLVNTQELPADDSQTFPTTWDFLDVDRRKDTAPSLNAFQVEVDGSPVPILGIGFSRRPLFAPLKEYDLRVGNSIFLLLGESISTDVEILVKDSPGNEVDYLSGLSFVTEATTSRVSPAIHVSQVGFEPIYEGGHPGLKQGFVSLYLGDLGVTRVDETTNEWVVDVLADASTGEFSELTVPLGVDLGTGFELIDAEDGSVVYTGSFSQRDDEHWVAYRSVLEADFSEVVDPGWYRLRVPGLGASLPFGIYEGVASTLARTLALGVYHQRSAQDHALPYTRFIDGPGHTAPSFIPFDDVAESSSYAMMKRESDSFFEKEDTVHPAPQVQDAETILYPYVGDVIAWWPMDEAEGLRDLSAHDAHGERFGGLARAESGGKVNHALHFDGVDDHARVNAIPKLHGVSELTMTFWIRVDTPNREQVLFSKGAGWECRYDPVTKGLKAVFGGVEISAPWRVVGDGAWHFIMLRFEADHSNGLHLFVDHLAAGEAASTLGMSTFPSGGEFPLYFGNLASLGTETFFHGMLDDVRWRKSLVSGEEALETSAGNGPWVDVTGGHFDAGDYSKYMKNSGLFVHVLAFMLDQGLEIGANLPQAFDHLGLPESGDGVSDLLQEVKWEADYIAKMQDTDGGFFSMVNPQDRRFENDVLPSEGYRQAVWPKTLISSGVAVGALAQLGNSPAFRAVYPQAAEGYREQALRGWDFIEAAVEKHGILGGHQRIFHYGEKFDANDELAYAAAALFSMTGQSKYEQRLIEWMPYDPDLIPNNTTVQAWRAFRRFTWQRLYESVGAAMRTYAFSNRGALREQERSFASDLVGGRRYVDHVLEEIIAAGDDQVARAQGSPFGASVTVESKRFGATNYFFGGSESFDLIAAELLDPKPEYGHTLLSNVNYQAGGNPLNVSFLSGLGWKQPRNFVSQWANNDERKLPPIGHTSGSVNSSLPFLDRYQAQLGKLTYPPYSHESQFAIPYGTYHRHADTWHVGNEFVILDHGRSLATMTYLMQAAQDHRDRWEAPPTVSIGGIPAILHVGDTATIEAQCEEDLSKAHVIWEASSSEPHRGSRFTIEPQDAGVEWLELEVLWPDGRRSFARETLPVRQIVESAYVENFQPPVIDYGPAPYRKILGNPNVQYYYPLDGNVSSAVEGKATPNVALSGEADFAPSVFDYPGYEITRPGYQSVRLQGAGDGVEVVYDGKTTTFPSEATWVSAEAMLYVETYAGQTEDADLLSLMTNRETRMLLFRNRWSGRTSLQLDYGESTDIPEGLPLRKWVHLRLVKRPSSASVFLDGVEILTVADDRFVDWLDADNDVRFRIGSFHGRVSDMILKAGSGNLETIDPIKEIIPNAPGVDISPSPRLDLKDNFIPETTIHTDIDGLSYKWSGPNGILIDPVDSRMPNITFTQTGEFELLLRVTNPEGIARVERTFLSVRDLSGNQAPVVNAGPTQVSTIPVTWQPQASVSDDGLPENTLAYEWRQISGPGSAVFSDKLALAPDVTFPQRGVYVFELVANDSHRNSKDQVVVAVQDEIREQVPGAPFITDAETLALYHFDGDFSDSSGNGFHLTPEGEPTFSDNVAWMKEMSGQSVAFAALGQQLEANLPFTERGFTVEWRFYPVEFLAYSIRGVPLVSYYQDYDVRLAFFQNRWTIPNIGEFDFANETVVSAEVLEPYLPNNTWIEMAMRYNASGKADFYINGVLIHEQTMLMNTKPDEMWLLTLGNFGGLIDELRVSRGPRTVLLPNRAPLVALDPSGVLEEPGTVVSVPLTIIDDGTDLTYAWRVVSGDAADIIFADVTAPDSAITFANVGLFTLELTVSDGELSTAATSHWAVGRNAPPVIRAEDNEVILAFGTAFVPKVVIEDDAWVGNANVEVSWTVIDGDPSQVTFSDPAVVLPSVSFAEAGEYTFRLKVSDGEFESDAVFQITVLAKLLPPVIRNPEPETSLRLDDRFSPRLTIEGDGPFSYQWIVSVGLVDNVSFSDTTALNPTVQFAESGEYQLTIMVRARDDVVTSTIQIAALPNLLPPVLRNHQPAGSLQLDEAFTPDLEIEGNGPFTYQWTVSHGETAHVLFSNPSTLNPTIQFTQVGEYELSIRASARDDEVTSTVQITVSSVPTPLERWRSANFLADTLTDETLQASVWGDLADPDGDRRVNLLEAYAGTNPLESDSVPFLSIRKTDGAIVLRWRRAQDPLGLSAKVLTSSTLEDFEPVVPAPSIITAGDESEVEARMSLSDVKGFLALSISSMP